MIRVEGVAEGFHRLQKHLLLRPRMMQNVWLTTLSGSHVWGFWEATKPDLKSGHLGLVELMVRPACPAQRRDRKLMKRLKTTGVVAGTRALPNGRWGRGQSETSENNVNGRPLAISALILVTMLLTIAPARFAAAAAVDEFNISIPIDTVVQAPEGSITVLATEPVGEQFAGQACTVAARTENQQSVHPGNDLIVESGSSLVRLENVESGAGTVVIAEGEFELGSEIVVSLIMGPDEVFSAGFLVHVQCVPTETTTTTEATTTTTNGQTSTTDVTAPPAETTSTVKDDSVLGITTTTVGDEVKDSEVLPLTGYHSGALLLLAGGVVALGGILVVGLRRKEG